MSRHRTTGWTVASAALIFAFSAPDAPAQSLLVIPDLAQGVDSVAVKQRARARYMRGKGANEEGARAAETAAAAALSDPARWDIDLVGEMSPATSERFWGEAQSGILPGSTIGLGSGNAAIYTEVGHVLSGAWRLSVGTTVAVAEEEVNEEPEAQQQDETPLGLNRFIAGGGSLSLQALRPIWLIQAGQYSRLGVIGIPRAWVNLPQLTSAENVDNYGWEAAASVLYQRQQNDSTPFLTIELRGGLAAGSEAFYQGIGHDDASSFVYLAPTVTISVVDQVNIGASYFWSPDLDSPGGIRLNLSLLNNSGDPKRQPQPRGDQTRPGETPSAAGSTAP